MVEQNRNGNAAGPSGSFGAIMYNQLNNQLAMHSNLLQQLTNQLRSHMCPTQANTDAAA